MAKRTSVDGRKVALVTGGSRGIGKAIAIAKAGMNVAINYLVSEDRAVEVVEAINETSSCVMKKLATNTKAIELPGLLESPH